MLETLTTAVSVILLCVTGLYLPATFCAGIGWLFSRLDRHRWVQNLAELTVFFYTNGVLKPIEHSVSTRVVQPVACRVKFE